MIELASASVSDQGPRPTNEDRCASSSPEAPVLERRGALFALADGLGGYEGGEIASDMAIRTLVEQYYSPLAHPRIEAALQRAVQSANLAVFNTAEREQRYRSMATTLDALVVTPAVAYIAHIGDSRVYQLRRGELRLLTQDHSEVAQLIRMRLLAPERLRDHPRRNILTRTIGTGLIVRPDFAREPVAAGDRYLLCTDGLWSAVDDGDIADMLRAPDPQGACTSLVRLALDRGADDNVTVQVIDVQSVDATPITRADDGEGVLRRMARRLIG